MATHTVDKNFQVDDAVIAEFKKFLTSQDVDCTDADINGVSDWVKAQNQERHLHHSVRPAPGPAHHRRMGSQMQKALTYMPEAQALEDNAHKVLAEKAQARNTQPQDVPTQP